jgi:hypothetical protein
MAEGSNIPFVSKSERATGTADDTLTLSAIRVVAAILTNVLHEGVGHGLTALLTGADSGLGIQLLRQSALPATAGGQSGLLCSHLLHSARDCTGANDRPTWPEIRVDCHGGDSGIRLCCRAGAWNLVAPLSR